MAFVGGMVANWFEGLVFDAESRFKPQLRQSLCRNLDQVAHAHLLSVINILSCVHFWRGSCVTQDLVLTMDIMLASVQIRLLVHERNELHRRAVLKEEELQKVDSRLQQALKDRTSMMAELAAMEKELADLRKGNEILKTKVISIHRTANFQMLLFLQWASEKLSTRNFLSKNFRTILMVVCNKNKILHKCSWYYCAVCNN